MTYGSVMSQKEPTGSSATWMFEISRSTVFKPTSDARLVCDRPTCGRRGSPDADRLGSTKDPRRDDDRLMSTDPRRDDDRLVDCNGTRFCAMMMGSKIKNYRVRAITLELVCSS
eukprot:m.16137 g.16137  ORF g.16137 m.16137 type:complete len:114 (-) comp10885_c0_seq1:183-524(-)